MKENDYLSPDSIRSQCDAAIAKLLKDNAATYTVEKSLNAFVGNGQITSTAFGALKQQISDYKTVLQAMRTANQSDMEDFLMLKLRVGNQELNGAVILEQKKSALAVKKSDEKNAENYRKKARAEKTLSLQMYYTSKVVSYQAMAEADQKMYNAWQEKENRYYEIEGCTSGLFANGAAMRVAAENALNSIRGAFQNGAYVPDMNAAWRGEINERYKNILSEIGYTQKELDMLKMHGVNLSYQDIINLKDIIGTDRILLSEDATALLYQGKVYFIYVPKDEESYEATWNIDGEKILTKTEFDWAAGILGINLEDIPKEELFILDNLQNSALSGKDRNTTTAVALHAVMGIQSFLMSGLSHMEISLVFQSSENEKRAMIMVGDSQTRLRMQEIDYDMPVNTYRDSEGVIGNKYASDYAIGIYELVTGEKVPDEDGTYTITGTLDERHKETNINGYLSYSQDGKLLYTPLVYAGDTAFVAECQLFTRLFTNEILDFTDMLSNPVLADDEIGKILEIALEKNEDGK